MKKYLFTGILVALVALLSVADANACGRGHRGYRGAGRAGMGFNAFADLDLSAEQQHKIADLRTKMIESMAQTRTELNAKRGELQSLWSAERPDRGAILAKQAEMDLLRKELRSAHIDFRLAVMDLLTAEQRAKFKAIRGKGFGGNCMGGCMGPCGGEGHHGPGPGHMPCTGCGDDR